MMEDKGIFQKLKEGQYGRKNKKWPEDAGEADRDHTVQDQSV